MHEPVIQLRLLFSGERTFGPGKAELLTLIERYGSIAAAGREMKMSYKRAWGLVEEMNATFRHPLVMTERGGAGRGGAKITESGAAILARYRQLQMSVDRAGYEEIKFIKDALADPDPSLPKPKEPDMF